MPLHRCSGPSQPCTKHGPYPRCPPWRCRPLLPSLPLLLPLLLLLLPPPQPRPPLALRLQLLQACCVGLQSMSGVQQPRLWGQPLLPGSLLQTSNGCSSGSCSSSSDGPLQKMWLLAQQHILSRHLY